MEQIKEYLRLYYEAQSTPEQEQVLFDFFQQNDLDVKWQEEAALFLSLYEASKFDQEKAPEELESRIWESIETEKSRKRKSIRLNWYKYAAAVLILFTSSFSFWKYQQVQEQKQEALLAYEQTREVLLYISKQLGKGQKAFQAFGEVEKAQKSISDLQKLSTGLHQLKELQIFHESIHKLKNGS